MGRGYNTLFLIDHASLLSVSQTPTTTMIVESPILKKLFAMRVNIACSRNFSYPTINKACAETDARAGRCASTTCSYTCVNPP